MERKGYISSFVGCFGKMGMVHKFNNAIGFKPVSFDVVTRSYPSNEPILEGYKTPSTAIFEAMKMVMDDRTVVCFDVEDEDVVHTNAKYSYNTKDILLKFFSFAKKVYPEIIVEEIASTEVSLVDDIFKHFYLCFAEGDFIAAEYSSPRLLDDNEKDYILSNLRQITNTEISLVQHYCETCAGYHPDCPYHIEITKATR
jgi:hypothetical protein